jgi:predicted MFS family arabinose efflux permease
MISVRRRLGPLQEPRFRLLWTAHSLSAIGDSMIIVAVTFAALRIGGSPTAVGLVFAANLVPRAGLMLVGGVWADRLPRQYVMLASDLVRGAGQSIGAFLLLTGRAELWHLALIAAVHGAGAAFFVPASSGLVPDTVSAARLQQANALMGLSRHVFGVAGPALSGVLVAAFDPGWVYAIDAITFAASAWFLVRLPVLASTGERKNFVADLVDGWRELTARSWVWTSIVYFSVWNLAIAPFFVLGPAVCERELGGARDWGLVMTGGSIGSIVGSLAALRARPRRPLVTGYLLISVAALQLVLLVRPFPALLIAAAALLAWITLEFSVTLWQTALQEHVPRAALSRVSAYDWLGSLLFMPAGFALAGPLAEAIGTDSTLLLSAAVLLGSNLAILAVPSVRALRRLDEAPLPAAAEEEPEPAPVGLPGVSA